MSVSFKVVIPARYASTRLPGKPLLEIAGWPMIHHVVERARESGAAEVIVATDDERVHQACVSFGADVVMTSPAHSSGSDRIAEVVRKRGWDEGDLVVNLQGDEPGMPPELIAQVAGSLAEHQVAGMATLGYPIDTVEALFDPHLVKVVLDRDGYALYFSRAPIPWHRDEFSGARDCLPEGTPFLRHIGLYAYRVGFLKRYVEWEPAPLERAESLEQLRVLHHGERIHVSIAGREPGRGVDTAEDLKAVERELATAAL